jgi:hypothetical protein
MLTESELRLLREGIELTVDGYEVKARGAAAKGLQSSRGS